MYGLCHNKRFGVWYRLGIGYGGVCDDRVVVIFQGLREVRGLYFAS